MPVKHKLQTSARRPTRASGRMPRFTCERQRGGCALCAVRRASRGSERLEKDTAQHDCTSCSDFGHSFTGLGQSHRPLASGGCSAMTLVWRARGVTPFLSFICGKSTPFCADAATQSASESRCRAQVLHARSTSSGPERRECGPPSPCAGRFSPGHGTKSRRPRNRWSASRPNGRFNRDAKVSTDLELASAWDEHQLHRSGVL